MAADLAQAAAGGSTPEGGFLGLTGCLPGALERVVGEVTVPVGPVTRSGREIQPQVRRADGLHVAGGGVQDDTHPCMTRAPGRYGQAAARGGFVRGWYGFAFAWLAVGDRGTGGHVTVDRVTLAAGETDTAIGILQQVFQPQRPFRFQHAGRPVQLSLTAAQAGELRAARFGWGELMCRAVAEPFDEFMAGVLIGGRINWSAGNEAVALRRTDVIRYSNTRPNDTSFVAYDIATISIPTATLERFAEAHLGIGAGELRFDGITAVSDTAARQWRVLTEYVHRSLAMPGPGLDSPLLLSQLTGLISATALTVFPNTSMTSHYRPGPKAVPPAALRRAVAYIDAHIGEPITLADIAAAGGVTGRSVQAAFRRYYATTPMGYLRRARLDAAHRDLQTGDPTAGDTVAAIAARWGFGSVDRFTASYRAQYGVLPSHTLRT
ncbi:helix-turn-helix transcriptional regulator [Dactylosporangium sp. CS-033363]|uniref:helix-turn-helix transcriptional regulator n=1 Tax=Dactylosporangium sp. CS-033363 TaxID=3239935 RepID=UPI003D8F94C6